MGVVDEAVEDGVRERGIGYGSVPVLERQLACHHGRLGKHPRVDRFEQIAGFKGRKRDEAVVG
ncbi:MAG: hypothetical protein Kow00122_13810 [Thermoleophilia bacterium]